MKKLLSLALVLALCLAMAVPALADANAAGGSFEEPVGESLAEPAPLPDYMAEGADTDFWLLYDYDRSKVLEHTEEGWGGTYTVLEGMEFTIWQNPSWQGTVSEVFIDDWENASDYIYFYREAYPEGLEDMRYMPPMTIPFKHNVTAPDGSVVDLAEMGKTYRVTLQTSWANEEFEDFGFMSTQITESFQVIPAVAYASTQTVDIDGRAVEFQMYAIKDANGNDTNYVKVRDVALALDGTAAQFNVGWDGNVNLEKGKAYSTRNGQENNTPYSGDQAFTCATSATNVDGEAARLTAFVITDAGGSGSTYYKLRDLGAALGFTVDWSGERGIYIETE